MDAELRLLRLLPLLLLSLLALPAGSAGGQEVGVDRPGSDLRPGFVLDTPDPALCAKVCELDTNCRAYTYVRPGYQGIQARCWLKGAVPNAVKNDCCISGVKFEGIAHQLSSFSPNRELAEQEADDRAMLQEIMLSKILETQAEYEELIKQINEKNDADSKAAAAKGTKD